MHRQNERMSEISTTLTMSKDGLKRLISPFLEVGFEKFFESHMHNYIGKLKMISGTDLTQTVKMNELFSPAGLALQGLWPTDCHSYLL